MKRRNFAEVLSMRMQQLDKRKLALVQLHVVGSDLI